MLTHRGLGHRLHSRRLLDQAVEELPPRSTHEAWPRRERRLQAVTASAEVVAYSILRFVTRPYGELSLLPPTLLVSTGEPGRRSYLSEHMYPSTAGVTLPSSVPATTPSPFVSNCRNRRSLSRSNSSRLIRPSPSRSSRENSAPMRSAICGEKNLATSARATMPPPLASYLAKQAARTAMNSPMVILPSPFRSYCFQSACGGCRSRRVILLPASARPSGVRPLSPLSPSPESVAHPVPSTASTATSRLTVKGVECRMCLILSCSSAAAERAPPDMVPNGRWQPVCPNRAARAPRLARNWPAGEQGQPPRRSRGLPSSQRPLRKPPAFGSASQVPGPWETSVQASRHLERIPAPPRPDREGRASEESAQGEPVSLGCETASITIRPSEPNRFHVVPNTRCVSAAPCSKGSEEATDGSRFGRRIGPPPGGQPSAGRGGLGGGSAARGGRTPRRGSGRLERASGGRCPRRARGASVCISGSRNAKGVSGKSRLRAETTPRVSVCSSPRGVPIACTSSPTRRARRAIRTLASRYMRISDGESPRRARKASHFLLLPRLVQLGDPGAIDCPFPDFLCDAAEPVL
jgi:hypothetical protein